MRWRCKASGDGCTCTASTGPEVDRFVVLGQHEAGAHAEQDSRKASRASAGRMRSSSHAAGAATPRDGRSRSIAAETHAPVVRVGALVSLVAYRDTRLQRWRAWPLRLRTFACQAKLLVCTSRYARSMAGSARVLCLTPMFVSFFVQGNDQVVNVRVTRWVRPTTKIFEGEVKDGRLYTFNLANVFFIEYA